ncbi:MAG: hypothetical protein IR164_14395 [Devosia sp.]|uniref:flagellin N-terminal helical domain-containing protein n=1 Tax=Devosia sp. TaxID=1871048 RepID=UPI0019F9B512|nr:flagellin [Devosia sp.]MBF0680116.1 hypothetical protein [Devosia sp.]
MSDISLSKAVRANLLSLQNTAEMMNKTQSRLATGNKVNSALDNPSNFFTASALNSRAADMSNLLDSMASGIKVIEAADKGITAITKNIEQMQSSLRQARQDKTFQTANFDVTKDSVLNIGGGQFGEMNSIKLGTATAGVSSAIKTEDIYNGPAVTAVATDADGEGAGARTVLDLDNVADLAGKSIKVDGKTVSFAATDNTVALAAQKLSDVLGADYTVTAGAAAGDENKIVIENAKVTGYASKSPVVELGAAAAGKASASFTYNAALLGAGVNVGSHTINVSGPATAGDFVASLQTQLNEAEDGRYSVSLDADTNVITVTDNQAGVGDVILTGGAFGTAALPATTTAAGGAIVDDASLQDLVGSTITLTPATGPAVNVTVTGTTTIADLNANGFQAEYGAEGINFRRNDLQSFTVSVSRTADTTPEVVSPSTSAAGAGRADAAALEAARNTAVTDHGPATLGSITLTAGANTATINLTDDLSDPANFADKLTAAGFAINYDATDGITFSRADGEDFTVSYTGLGGNDVFGAASGTSIGGVTAAYVAAAQAVLNADALQDAADHAEALGYTGASTAAASSAGGSAAVPATITVTQVPGTAGVTSKATAAASDEITITYGNKTADIKVTGADASGDRSAIAKSINDQLKTAGMDNLEASFDNEGKLSISAKNAEAIALTVTGAQAEEIFGSDTKMTNTGSATVSGYNSKNAVDMFVEEINRNPATAGKIRASNDNGKLRIENLSTQALDISHDADGDGVLNPVSSKIAGNSVRANLSKQFNDLRDQLDKFADDSSFNGINLLRGDKLTITFNESGSSAIQIQAKDKDGNERPITAANLNIEFLNEEDLDTDEKIDKLLTGLQNALTELRSQASTFGSNLSSVENRQNFTKNMINTLETGAANLTLADTNEEAANLLALQTRQQLSSSALSMASQQDQAVLQLLR